MHHEYSNDCTALMNWADCPAVEQDPQRHSGVWMFRGTRVPVAALFQNLSDGVSLAEFVEIFPGFGTAQTRLVLDHAARNTTGTSGVMRFP
jgi:uncharacterized protein (DUF433 family)